MLRSRAEHCVERDSPIKGYKPRLVLDGYRQQYHAPLETMRDEILENAKPIADLRKRNLAQDAESTDWLRQHGYSDENAVFQGLKARARDIAVILDAKTAKVIGIAPFKPWG